MEDLPIQILPCKAPGVIAPNRLAQSLLMNLFYTGMMYLLFAGCLMTQGAQTEQWKIEIEPPSDKAIGNITQKVDSKWLKITGIVHRRQLGGGMRSGHLDITLLDSEGNKITEKTESIRFSKEVRVRNYKSFAISIPLALARQAKVIRLEYYSNLHIYHSSK